ncbi:MAG: hypothetical protein WBX15_01870 [Thermoanaerobaculia bacterium]
MPTYGSRTDAVQGTARTWHVSYFIHDRLLGASQAVVVCCPHRSPCRQSRIRVTKVDVPDRNLCIAGVEQLSRWMIRIHNSAPDVYRRPRIIATLRLNVVDTGSIGKVAQTISTIVAQYGGRAKIVRVIALNLNVEHARSCKFLLDRRDRGLSGSRANALADAEIPSHDPVMSIDGEKTVPRRGRHRLVHSNEPDRENLVLVNVRRENDATRAGGDPRCRLDAHDVRLVPRIAFGRELDRAARVCSVRNDPSDWTEHLDFIGVAWLLRIVHPQREDMPVDRIDIGPPVGVRGIDIRRGHAVPHLDVFDGLEAAGSCDVRTPDEARTDRARLEPDLFHPCLDLGYRSPATTFEIRQLLRGANLSPESLGRFGFSE